MKKICCLLLLTIYSVYGQNYENQWKKVLDLENEGKVKSASLIVDKIYKKAYSSHNETQQIKCFFYQSKYMQTLEEDAKAHIISRLQADLKRMSAPSKSILYTIYGKCLNDYLKRNTYAIYSRTKIDSSQAKHFLTWSGIDFENEIDSAFQRSIANEAVFKATKLDPYEPIFDFLSVKAFKKQQLLEYLLKENLRHYAPKVNSTRIKTATVEKVKYLLWKSSAAFATADLDFIVDSNARKMIQLYQKLEANYPTVENKLDRVLFLGTMIQDQRETLKMLDRIQRQASDTITTQRIQFEKATIYSNLASKQSAPDFNIKAVQVLDSLLKIKSRSNAYFSALVKRQQITSKTISVEMQEFVYPNEHTRAFIRYKNADYLTLSFFQIPQKTVVDFSKPKIDRDSLVAVILQKNPKVKTMTHRFANEHNYFEYSTEVKLPQLETGSYFVYYQSDASDPELTANAYGIITVSSLTALANVQSKEIHFQVLDRKTGKPIEKALVKSNGKDLVTNHEGIAIGKSYDNNYEKNDIQIIRGNDTIQLFRNYFGYDRYHTENSIFKARTHFYLDRGIYRPGQTVYYKGITIQNKDNVVSVVPNVELHVNIDDQTGKTIKEFDITTNEFGSFSGEFVIPKNALTGNFYIEADEPDEIENDPMYDKKNKEHPFWDNVEFQYSKESFSVEEYKRPKFEVVFDSVKESYAVNQEIKANGNANAFSGAVIADAKVSYTVTRTTRDSYSGYYHRESDEDWISGETKTDAKGKFTIAFTAEPDEEIEKKNLPIFSYKIHVAVTDINGETRTADQWIKVGYHSLQLEVNVPKVVETKNKAEIVLNSTNLNGQFVAAQGELKLYFLKKYPNKFKNRIFPEPEVQTISEEDFTRWFPYEKNKEIKNSEILVYSKKIHTLSDKAVILDFISNYQPGYYKVVFSATDPYQNAIEKTVNFEIAQSNIEVNPSELLTLTQLNDDAKKDGFVELKIASTVPNLYLVAHGSYNTSLFFEKRIDMKNREATIKIPIEKHFKQELLLGFESVFENQKFYKDIVVKLKDDQPKIAFEVESFRDKIEPGSKENWSFRLMADKASESEILASMYDSSLDEFASSYWDKPDIKEDIYNYPYQHIFLGEGRLKSWIKNLNSFLPKPKFRNEDTQLIWFGFDFNNLNPVSFQKLYKEQITKKSAKPENAKLISGIITDESFLPLPGANITVKGSHRGTQSDFDGYYEIEAAVGEILVFDFIGMESKTVPVTGKIMNIALENSNMELSEVVVTSQGIKKEKKALGYATTTVTSEEIEAEQDGLQFLSGKAAGIDISMAGASSKIIIRGYSSVSGTGEALVVIDGVPSKADDLAKISGAAIASYDVLNGLQATTLYGSAGANGVILITTKNAVKELTKVKARSDLSETAFFYPQLKADAKGNVRFSFTAPESLTQWKMRLLAHNKNAISGFLEKTVIAQKDFMVVPNLPRFLREKDTIVITTKITNITKETKNGIAVLQLFDASNRAPIDAVMQNTMAVKNFNTNAFGSTTVSWKISIPEGLQGVECKILAKAGDFSDGEETFLPVLANNILVTETIPVWVRENSQKNYTLENLKYNTSTTLRNHQLTLEYTSNPVWIAIQSLPYLMEYEHECAEQTFARFYANAMASEIIRSNPKIASVIENWKQKGKLNATLEKNQQFKSILLAETPWATDALSEEDQKKRLSLLFDLDKMKESQEIVFEKLRQKQKPSGGLSWFDDGPESEFITCHILAGLGHLQKLTRDSVLEKKIASISKSALNFLDRTFVANHQSQTRNSDGKKPLIWHYRQNGLHYLYARSFYLGSYPVSDRLSKTIAPYLKNIKENYLEYSLYEKGLAALILHRFDETPAAQKILTNLKETASNHEDWGMYWVQNKAGYYWYRAPIETQALLIEAFNEINKDYQAAEAMKVWLLKNKQNKNWSTTKSTTEAIYALMMQGNDWLSVKDNTVLQIGNQKILSSKLSENEKEAETGYIKLNWKADEVKKEMAAISIQNKSKVPGYGGIYWQYFEDLQNIKVQPENVLNISKALYLKSDNKQTDLQLITPKTVLKIGDLVTVRLVVNAKEDLEYVHLKDMRASCFEPVDVLSKYIWNDVSYYRSTKDAATHFFFDNIKRGTYVIQYDIRVNNSGDFSNGITTIQSMYAPEFSSHTSGIRVKIQ